jgi:hypothetical protein
MAVKTINFNEKEKKDPLDLIKGPVLRVEGLVSAKI